LLPDVRGRRDILNLYLGKSPVAEGNNGRHYHIFLWFYKKFPNVIRTITRFSHSSLITKWNKITTGSITSTITKVYGKI